MTALYQFIQEHRVGSILWRSGEYRDYCRFSRVQEERLRAMLDEKGLETLDSMLQEQSNLHHEELAATFQATILLCRELNDTSLSYAPTEGFRRPGAARRL